MLTPLRDGLRMFVREVGAGTPLVLVHGFAGSSEAWGAPVLDGLAAAHRIVAVDLLGHGASDAPGDPRRYAMREMLRDLLDVADALALDRATWVGYSMGGRVVLAVAVHHPERVDRLVLESTSAGIAETEARRARREEDEEWARQLEECGIAEFVDAWERRPLFATRRRLPVSTGDALRAVQLRNRPRALAACLRGLGTGAQAPLWPALPGVQAHTLLVTGTEDHRFDALARRMEAGLVNARRVTIPGAGHTVHLERPAEWLDAVRRFCR